MRSRHAAGLLLSLALVAGCANDAGAAHQMTGTRLDPPFEVNGAALVDGAQAPYSLVEDTDKDLTLVFFGYTHCPDICAAVMSTMASAMTRLSEQERSDVDVVFVTTDPQRDTPEVSADYAANYDPAFIGVSGELDTIIEVALPLGIAVEQGDKLPTGGYAITHGTQVIAVDADDQGVAYWNEDVSSAQLAADIQRLLSERD